ncbi:MAG: hypothetical protein OQK47_04000 [Gammaproteobacteria bacterium]|nr:hypothetical protein [Gammaproteobacteria bacterium]
MENRISKMILAACLTMLVGLTGFTGSVMANTPDGETPANEGVCDVLHGGTPGLYGLCVAYCEAQDLDSFDKQPPNTKILSNYRKKMQDGDPDMPCIKVPCPCWSDEEIASFTTDGAIAACIGGDSSDKVQVIDNAVRTKFADADITPSSERCRYIDLNTDPRIIRSFTITAEEAQGCFTVLVNTCNSVQ